MSMMTPKQIVDALDRYIIGQEEAKRAVAIALRNRYRRSCLSEELREEITPKNIIMLGPTGVGKTEIARRLAKLVDAPFIKVEATKFTEVGYVGKDVESMIRDLVEESIRLTKNIKMNEVKSAAEAATEARIVELLLPNAKKHRPPVNPLQYLLGSGTVQESEEPKQTEEEKEKTRSLREQTLGRLRAGLLENEIIEIEVEESSASPILAMGVDMDLGSVLGDMLPKKRKQKKMPVSQARPILMQQESEKRIDMDDVNRLALINAEQNGIIFLDEIDKIAGAANRGGADVSREGVQRDILPIVEGTTVSTKYGPIKTDFILFIGAGAFHVSKVSDLIPELQGRFPIRVTLKDLTEEDFYNILTQPDNAVTKQYAALLRPDNVNLSFTEDALREIAKYAFRANEQNENIGARRLHTVMENLLNDISFNANGQHPLIDVVIDGEYVDSHLDSEWTEDNIHKYIL
ncbi:MAG: ATP-dependent protease ATPase subunit HslU [Clostridia bacterium]|nr:ATP-dependent protease ATPase subunit HslU [Clostridia bacterium]